MTENEVSMLKIQSRSLIPPSCEDACFMYLLSYWINAKLRIRGGIQVHSMSHLATITAWKTWTDNCYSTTNYTANIIVSSGKCYAFNTLVSCNHDTSLRLIYHSKIMIRVTPRSCLPSLGKSTRAFPVLLSLSLSLI